MTDPLAEQLLQKYSKDERLFGATNRAIEALEDQILDLTNQIAGLSSNRVLDKASLEASRDALIASRDALKPARIAYLEANSNVADVRAAVATKQGLVDQLAEVERKLLSRNGFYPKGHPARVEQDTLTDTRVSLINQINAVVVPALVVT